MRLIVLLRKADDRQRMKGLRESREYRMTMVHSALSLYDNEHNKSLVKISPL
jgi:hypothetical protein